MQNQGRKSPPTGYQQFIKDHKEEIRQIWKTKNEEARQEGQKKATLFEVMAAEWKRLPATVRAQYTTEARERMKKFHENSASAW